MEKLSIDLKALNPAQEIDLYILFIAYRRKGKSTVICPDIRLKAPIE